MVEELKFIFKTLIKIPCIIMVLYLIFNIFAFSLTYFRMLGASYAVMNTALINNYIPPQEKKDLQQYIDGFETQNVKDITLIGKDSPRTQYGTIKEVGVSYTYKWIWPLTPQDQGLTFGGYDEFQSDSQNGTTYSALTDAWKKSDDQIQADLEAKAQTGTIKLIYKVPGLQYYADLN